jgi:hypothetical protein
LAFEPLLLDIADLVAYSAARAVSSYEYRNKSACIDVFNIVRPEITHWWWNSENHLKPEIAKIINSV